MTHLGDNPFANNANLPLGDDELASFLDDISADEIEKKKIDQQGLEMLTELISIVDAHGINRLFDIDQEVEESLQEARREVLLDIAKRDLLETEEGVKMYAEGDHDAIIEYSAGMALLSERSFQNNLITRAMRMRHVYEASSGLVKIEALSDIEHEKRVWIVLLTDHYNLPPEGWPAAFDKMTPGKGILPGMDIKKYQIEAEKESYKIMASESREQEEIEEIARLIGVDEMENTDEMVSVMLTIATVQAGINDIQGMRETNAPAQRAEMIWEYGDQIGLPVEARQAITRYYDEKYQFAA